MALDASFLLELFQVFVHKEAGKELTRVSSRMSNLLDFAGIKSAHNAVLCDMVMLENQIPLFVLQKVLEIRYLIMPPQAAKDSLKITEIEEKGKEVKDEEQLEAAGLLDSSNSVSKALDQIKNLSTKLLSGLLTILNKLFTNLLKGPLRNLSKRLHSGPLKIILKLPLSRLSKILGLTLIAKPLESLSPSQSKESIKPEEESSSDTITKPPLVKEIAIPSVSELSKS
ncbi:Protein of unknown function DUF247, plant, partial [Dillenia turbinata]